MTNQDAHLITISLGQEGVEAENELVVSSEKVLDALNHAWGVNALRLEVLHDVEELVVDVRLVRKLHLDLVQVQQRVLHLQFA